MYSTPQQINDVLLTSLITTQTKDTDAWCIANAYRYAILHSTNPQTKHGVVLFNLSLADTWLGEDEGRHDGVVCRGASQLTDMSAIHNLRFKCDSLDLPMNHLSVYSTYPLTVPDADILIAAGIDEYVEHQYEGSGTPNSDAFFKLRNAGIGCRFHAEPVNVANVLFNGEIVNR